MRDHSNHIELSRQEAVRQLFDALEQGDYAGKTTQKTENVALDEAFGRTLAVAVKAKTDIPNVLTCGMDSVAVHWSAFEGLAEGELPDTSAWVRGRDWQFANTGVAMPEGFDTAIVIEHVEVSADEQHITIDAAPSAQYAGTRAAGSNMR
jgi:molybdopterin biosynthesis enzyme